MVKQLAAIREGDIRERDIFVFFSQRWYYSDKKVNVIWPMSYWSNIYDLNEGYSAAINCM